MDKMNDKKVNEPGEFTDEEAIVLDKPTGDKDFDGVSVSFLRFGDMENERYEEKLERDEEEIKE